MNSIFIVATTDLGHFHNFGLAQAGMPASAPAAPAAAPVAAAPAAGTTTAPGATTGTPLPSGAAAGPSALLFPLMMVGLLIFMILISVMSGRKEKKRREAMMSALGRGDKVSTSAGIIGTITDINDADVVIRSEDSRLRVTKAAITGVLSSANRGGGASSAIESKDANKPVGV